MNLTAIPYENIDISRRVAVGVAQGRNTARIRNAASESPIKEAVTPLI